MARTRIDYYRFAVYSSPVYWEEWTTIREAKESMRKHKESGDDISSLIEGMSNKDEHLALSHTRWHSSKHGFGKTTKTYIGRKVESDEYILGVGWQ